MKLRTRFFALFLVFSVAAWVQADEINYGNFEGATVTYIDVTESSTEELPLYGTPEIFGNQLDMPGTGFISESNNGEIDFLDGRLTFMVEADRAIALNPNHSSTLAQLGNDMVWAGELERGTALLEKAIVLNPKHPDWYYLALGAAHYYRSEYDEALALQQKINMPNFFGAYFRF